MAFRDSIRRIYSGLKNIISPSAKPGWHGSYKTWDDALRNSTGYDSALIVEKVKNGLLEVKNEEAAFERDSVVFQTFEYSWPVLSGLLWVAAQEKGKLRVLDFGGSLGSTFFQYRKFLRDLDVQWNIIEQENFVACGKQYFEDERLHFFHTTGECLEQMSVNVILLSSVLPYLREPYKILSQLIELDCPYILFDKMPFLTDGDQDRLTVQTVHPSIYPASYPAWFFNKTKFVDVLTRRYIVIEEFTGDDKANIPSVFKGLIAQRKKL